MYFLCCSTYFCVVLCIFVLFYVFLCCSMYVLCCFMYFCVVICIFALFYVFFVLFYVFFVLFYVFLCCSMHCLFCDVLCIVCVYMCTELLPPGGYPITVKCIISYHTVWEFVLSEFTHVCLNSERTPFALRCLLYLYICIHVIATSCLPLIRTYHIGTFQQKILLSRTWTTFRELSKNYCVRSAVLTTKQARGFTYLCYDVTKIAKLNIWNRQNSTEFTKL